MMKQIAALLAIAASTSALELTPDNYFEKTDGKTVFLKFFAPWCGHCKAIKPDWDKLIADFADSPTQLVADVDCTAEGEALCNDNGVQGFPTLKWGDPSDLQEYNGGRSYDDLKLFADENLKPLCSVKNIELCDDIKTAQIKKYQDMSLNELKNEIESEEEFIKDAEMNFEMEVEQLQQQFERLSQEKDDAIADVKSKGLGLMKSVLKTREAPATKDEL